MAAWKKPTSAGLVMGAVCFGIAGFLALSSLPRESSAVFCAAAGKFMEQR